MKITFVKPIVSQNGGSRVVAIYAQKLLERGHDVVVVSRVPSKPGRLRRLANAVRGRTVKYPPNRTRFFDPLGDRHIQIDRDGPLLPEDLPDADIVIATWWRTAFEVATMPPEKGAKAYFVQHYEVHDHLPWDISGGSYWLPLRKITISEWLAGIMAEKYADRDVPIVLNSVDTDQFSAPKRTRNKRPRIGFMYAEPKFKGTAYALKAIAAVKKVYPEVEVLAFGKTKAAPGLPLPKGTIYHEDPDQGDIPGLYASCDVWLVSSLEEGFGLPILEAMACRTPIVTTRCGAAESFVANGVEGYVVPPGDADALAQGVLAVLGSSEDAWQAMSSAAYQRIQKWSWDDATSALEAELNRIVADHTSGADPI